MASRDLVHIDVAALFFDANDVDMELDTIRINVPKIIQDLYLPDNMCIEGPFEDGSILVGLKLVLKR